MTTLLNPRPTRNHDPLPATGRAGRNLPAAVGVAVVLIAVVLGSLAFQKIIFVGVVVLAVCGALWELAAAFARKNIRLPLAPLWLGTLGISVCAWELGAEAAFGAYVATAGACVLWSFMDHAEAETGTVLEQAGHDIPRTDAHDEVRRSRSSAAAASVFAATYLPYLAGFAVLLLVQDHGVGKVMMLIALAAASDTGGWLAGDHLRPPPHGPLGLAQEVLGGVHGLPAGGSGHRCRLRVGHRRPLVGRRRPGYLHRDRLHPG